jgi:uncharacterized membrane protein
MQQISDIPRTTKAGLNTFHSTANTSTVPTTVKVLSNGPTTVITQNTEKDGYNTSTARVSTVQSTTEASSTTLPAFTIDQHPTSSTLLINGFITTDGANNISRSAPATEKNLADHTTNVPFATSHSLGFTAG